MASIFARFFGRTVSEAAAFGAGIALGPVLAPVVRELENTTWAAYPVKPPPAVTLALGVAQGQVDRAQAEAWAEQTGFGTAAFTALVDIANTGPGVPAAFDLWRRNVIDEPGFRRAAKRVGLEQEWIDDLAQIKNVLLDTSVIANAVQQGHMPNDGILPPPVGGSPPFTIPLTQIDLDPLTEAAGHGVTRERLQIITNLVGLPPGDQEMLHMWNRGIIDEESVDAGIREGHRKTKWIPAVKELRWAILSPIQYVEARLRGWIGDPEMYAGGLKSGMRKPEMDLLFKTHGRPPSWHQIWIGLQRGGTYDGPTTDIHPAFLSALRQSDIRPEWYNLLWHSRYTLPSAFVLRALTSDGTFTAAQAEAILIDSGWVPAYAAQAAAKWAGGTAATGDPHVSKAQTQLWATAHASYKSGEATAADVQPALTLLGVDAAAVPQVLAVWDAERALVREQLTPTQVRKAVNGGVLNRVTGATWTRADGLARLTSMGYSTADAETFLDED